eukprot:TRINITY_DN11819_c4_g2_i1.p1 TRINITY_DN11819_c4_g2~~TRINITY_DN11819_c4_g2_i1.p1  ORF type:complete len:960 (+),score=384.84 TRINITY_DN11819_c4_g2_i1:74-2953(+)
MALPGQTDNLTELENLNEETLLNELKHRYNRDVIYTYVGEILVAVNPFKMIDGIYSDAKATLYTNAPQGTPPHIFATADAAFTAMTTQSGDNANQVAVISGESGAGKTESAKLFMKHVIYLSTKVGGGGGQQGLEEKIIQLNPLLESWGNAATLRNDNSSRFGKFVQLRFNDSHQIQGALMSDYLLEKSRVVSQGEGERNFHVFYLMFAGMDADELEKYDLVDAGEHAYINGNNDAIAAIDSQRMKDEYAELAQCIETVGFSQQEKEDMWAILAGVLITGDIEFAGEDSAYVVSGDDVMAKACNQLGIVQDALTEALTCSINIMRGEKVERHYKPEEADGARDAMAKALYHKTFRWIVRRVNELLGPKRKAKSSTDKDIGILDIFGFECFDVNSFEQLLINLANERLQSFFNNFIFKMELDEYAKEGIDGSQIDYEDNEELLKMILDKPGGLLALCDEEAKVPKGSDQSMTEKFHQNLKVYKGYEAPRGNELKFTVHHYAGAVKYESEGFLEKNRDQLPMDVVGALRLSDNALVRSLFDGDADDAKAAKKGKAKRNAADARKSLRMSMKKVAKQQAKTKKTTVGAEFKDSLVALMTEMSKAQPHFVRCIKPNHQKKPAIFEDGMITDQLRYTGMLETTRIRKEGYAFRPTFSDFLDRFKMLGFPFGTNPPATHESCAKVLAVAGCQGWQVGKTKVFLRYFHMDELNEKFKPFPAAASVLSRAARGFIARQNVRKLKQQAAQQAKAVEDFCIMVERKLKDFNSVNAALMDEDDQRPADFWTKKAEPKQYNDPKVQKLAKKAGKKGGFNRAASVRWFKEVEMKKGSGINNGKFENWFHGVITRKDSEALLRGKPAGTFLVRVSESRFGYSLSHVVREGSRIKHYMIDQTPDGQYQVIGNRRLFGSLNELVEYHGEHKIVADDPVCLEHACGQVAKHFSSLLSILSCSRCWIGSPLVMAGLH